MNVVLQYRASAGFRALLDEACLPGLRIHVVDEGNAEDFSALMREANVLLHVLKPVAAEIIAGAPKLRLIQKIGVGVNTIDLEAAKAGGIAVCNMPGSNSQAVAEMTLMLMLAALRRAAYFDSLTRRGAGWHPEEAMLDGVGEVGGRTVGFVGFGSVPQRVAPAVRALGAQVICTARTPKPGHESEFRPLSQVIEEADVLSLHVPATAETKGLIDRSAIARMKRGAVLVNTARGELIDEVALVEALRSGHLRAAGLDVFAREPLPMDHPLLALPSVVLSPHVAWLTPETLRRSVGLAMENCRRLSAGEPLLNRVV